MVLTRLFLIARCRRLESLDEAEWCELVEDCLMAIYCVAWCKIFFISIFVCSYLPSGSYLSFSSKLDSRCDKLCCGIASFCGRDEVVGRAALLPWPRKFEFCIC